jgi:hypothetical protein
MRATRFIATFAAVTAALATVGAASASAPPTSEPAPSQPATTDTVAPSIETGNDHLSGEAAEVFAMESEFARCMRENGVEDYPAPQVNDDGIIVVGVPFGTRGDTAMDAAREACQHIFQQGGPPEEAGDAAGWEKFVPGGDCQCADGSEFAFWERRADPTKVVFYLEGGGACWTAEMCAFTGNGESPFYSWNVHDGPPSEGGIFDVTNPDNPFADYSFVYVPYCTGDVHLGDATREYSPELTVQHKGYVNGTTALTSLAEHYPDAAQVVVVGVSAGSVAAPVYGGVVADLLPQAQVTVLADSSGTYPDDPDLNTEILGEQWGALETMPDWEVNEGLTAADWGPPRFWVQAGLHDPDLVLARFDFAYDEVQAFFMEQLEVDTSDLVAAIDANEAAIEDAGVVQHSYTAPGNDHGVVGDNLFYTLDVNGVPLVDWVATLIAGEVLDDVHCDQCQPT